jgi:hypothetical protein
MKNIGVSRISSFCAFHFELKLRLRFLVRRMLAAELAILVQVQLVRRVPLVLHRRIVLPLALAAGEENDLTHCLNLTFDFGFRISGRGCSGFSFRTPHSAFRT